MNRGRCLKRQEVYDLVDDLRRRAKRSRRTRQNLIIVLLVVCCGLRRSELCRLNLEDIETEGPEPCVFVRETKSAAGRRVVPLTWGGRALEDIRAWVQLRSTEGAGDHDPVLLNDKCLRRLADTCAANRWRTEITKVLGAARAKQVSIHAGRHTFITHAASKNGEDLGRVRDVAGHANLSTTSRYIHPVQERAVNLYGI